MYSLYSSMMCVVGEGFLSNVHLFFVEIYLCLRLGKAQSYMLNKAINLIFNCYY